MTDLLDPKAEGVADATIPGDATSEPSLRDTIRANFAEAAKADATPKAEKPEKTEDRDDKGKFTAKEKRETLTLPKKESETQPAKEPAPSLIKAPEGWSANAKAKFAQLDPEVQAEVVRRETETHRRLTSQDEDRIFGKRIKDIAAPYQAVMSAEGATHEAAFQAYLNTAYILRTASPEAKVQALLSIAKQFNVPLGTPLQPASGQPTPAPQQVDISRIVQAEIQQHQDREQQRRSAAEIEAFKAKPGHEHFEDLKGVVKGLLESGRFDKSADPLQDAYDAAFRADPELGSGYIAQKLREAEEQRTAQTREKTDAAKRAAVSVTGSPGGVKPNGSTGTKSGSLRDQLRANLNEVVSGRIS